MMSTTTLSDGGRTRPRFAAPTPTPPRFLIGTDDPARIGILSDQRESKGFGWDPAKTLRMAEPPEFLIGTIDQSENHSTPSKQPTNPNPNGHKTRFSRQPRRLAVSGLKWHRRPPTGGTWKRRLCAVAAAGISRIAHTVASLIAPHPLRRLALCRISRPPSGLPPLVYPERRRASPASRRAQPHLRNPDSSQRTRFSHDEDGGGVATASSRVTRYESGVTALSATRHSFITLLRVMLAMRDFAPIHSESFRPGSLSTPWRLE